MFAKPRTLLADAQLFVFRSTGAVPDMPAGAQVLVIDRNDGLADFVMARRALRLVGQRRINTLDVITEKDRGAIAMARYDGAGQANLEIVRRLNQTAFCGTLQLVGGPNLPNRTLMRLLNRLAIDFKVDCVALSQLDAALPLTFNAA